MVHKIAHTVRRGHTIYYNRRVPEALVEHFGCTSVRINLGTDGQRAAWLAEGLSARLDELWGCSTVLPVDLNLLLKTVEPSDFDLISCTHLYLSSRQINEKPEWLAVHKLIEVAGNKDVAAYSRSDARQTVDALLRKGNKTATVRRRVQSLHAILEFGYHEQDSDRRNPFARLTIPSEGKDSLRRGVFTDDHLSQIYKEALCSGRDTWLVLPILGETGARLAEIVGLRWQDVCMETDTIKITPHSLRRLKTRGSERDLPLVGHALSAIRQLHGTRSKSDFVFSRWVKDHGVVATHASNTLNKHIKRRARGLTCHCFRHTLRDRLRNTGCPSEIIDQIGGWTSSLGVGARYGRGYNIKVLRAAMEKASIRPTG